MTKPRFTLSFTQQQAQLLQEEAALLETSLSDIMRRFCDDHLISWLKECRDRREKTKN